jgi:hypothetical protein
MTGGLLEYTALIVGYRDLLVLAALLYAVALLTRPRSVGGAPEAPAVVRAGAGPG